MITSQSEYAGVDGPFCQVTKVIMVIKLKMHIIYPQVQVGMARTNIGIIDETSELESITLGT